MTSSKDDLQISHLIRLLDDRDEFVRSKIRERLIEIGEDALPFLEMAVRTENPAVGVLAREIISAIHPQKLGERFRQLVLSARRGDPDLEAGMLCIMEFGYPGVSAEAISRPLDQMADELSSRLNQKDSPQRTVHQLVQYLFLEKEFSGNQTNFMDPDNSYFNKVLERRTGIPISLSALCVLIANRLNLPIVGVGLPGHYIVKYDSATQPIFFDPFHRGRTLSKEDCIKRVNNLGHKFEEYHLSPSTNRETLVRMMNNLAMIYQQNGEPEKSKQLKEYIKILLNSPQSLSSNSS